ncbi:MAG: STAS domain-containing protein [Verrucomicrobiota bacterium]
MADHSEPIYLVDGYSDPAVLRIRGRASYLNASPLSAFFKRMVDEQKLGVVVDFAQCSAMDSTFLGILAGAALDFRKQTPPMQIELVNLGTRNLELVRNLGLHRILEVQCNAEDLSFDASGTNTAPNAEALDEERSSAVGMLKAHEKLIEADPANQKKFQDVIAFLRLQVQKDEDAT